MAYPPDQHLPNPNAFLMGGSVPSASFLAIGATVTGMICELPTLQQQRDMQTNEPKTWDDGSPMLQLVVTLQTDDRDPGIEDDDGRRRIYIRFNMKKAIADAVRKAGAKSLEPGGVLTVTYSADGETTRKGVSPPKLYTAEYVPPAENFLNDKNQDAEPNTATPPATPAKSGDNAKRISVTLRSVDSRVVDYHGQKVNVYGVETSAGRFGTMNQGIGEQIKAMAAKSAMVELTYTDTPKGKRIDGVQIIDDSEPPISEEEIPF